MEKRVVLGQDSPVEGVVEHGLVNAVDVHFLGHGLEGAVDKEGQILDEDVGEDAWDFCPDHRV